MLKNVRMIACLAVIGVIMVTFFLPTTILLMFINPENGDLGELTQYDGFLGKLIFPEGSIFRRKK